jgi:hypothetical protein
VHGEEERDDRRRAHLFFVEPVARQIARRRLAAGVAQPGGWRGEPEGLAPEVVRRKEKDRQLDLYCGAAAVSFQLSVQNEARIVRIDSSF